MKNTERGFIVPLLLVIIAFMLVGGGAYVYTQKKQVVVPVPGSSVSQMVLSEASTTKLIVTQTGVPKIVSISPSDGPVGTVATIQGSLPEGTKILFDREVVGQTASDMSSFTFIVPNFFQVENAEQGPIQVFTGGYEISLASSTGTILHKEGDPIVFTVTRPVPVTSSTTPVVTSIDSPKIIAGARTRVTIQGSNFRSTNMIAIVGAGSVTSVAPEQISPDGKSITFLFPEALAIPAIYTVEVYDAGGVQQYTRAGYVHSWDSSTYIEIVNPAAPTITRITPALATVGSTVTIFGSNFYNDLQLNIGTYLPSVGSGYGPITITSRSNTSLSFVVPPSMTSRTYVISVVGSGGHTSNEVMFTVVEK